MTENQRGLLAQKLFETECVRRNLAILHPVDTISRYDLATEENGKLKRIQIKYCGGAIKDSKVRLNLQSYKDHEIDCLMVYFKEKDCFLNIPVDLIKGKGKIYISLNNKNNFYWRNFLW
jgi:hypothetical protein